jgi:hypothetical protein
VLAAAAEGQQQGVVGPAQRMLGRVHDVVDEQKAAALDVQLVRAADKARQGDDVLPPPGKAARRGVGDEPELGDDAEHALAGVRVNEVGAAQHARHGGGRDTGHPGNIIDSCHLCPNVSGYIAF